MKIKIKTVPKTEEKRLYITDDGQEFYSEYLALRHDAGLLPKREIPHDSIPLPDDETYMVVYKIMSPDDWKYVVYSFWDQHSFGATYTGPGWYGAIRHDGGDYHDRYEIYKIDFNYISKYINFISELKDLTSVETMV